jgi:hypothetical protein
MWVHEDPPQRVETVLSLARRGFCRERGGKCAPNLYKCQYANYCKLLQPVAAVLRGRARSAKIVTGDCSSQPASAIPDVLPTYRKPPIVNLVDQTHPAAEFLNDAVVRDGLADKLGGVEHWLTAISN